MMTKCRIGGREIELDIDNRVRGGVGGGAIERDSLVRRTAVSNHAAAAQNSRELVANPAPAPISLYYPYKNKLEKAFSVWLDAQWRAGAIKGYIYEPFSFKLAEGKRYRVDFVSWGDEGVVCWETKGWHANIRDSLTHLKWAAQRFPFFKWRKAMRKKGTFEYQDIVV